MYIDLKKLKQNEWVSVEGIYAVVIDGDRGPRIELCTGGKKRMHMFPDKVCRQVQPGEVVQVTRVCLKGSYAFFRSIPAKFHPISDKQLHSWLIRQCSRNSSQLTSDKINNLVRGRYYIRHNEEYGDVTVVEGWDGNTIFLCKEFIYRIDAISVSEELRFWEYFINPASPKVSDIHSVAMLFYEV